MDTSMDTSMDTTLLHEARRGPRLIEPVERSVKATRGVAGRARVTTRKVV
jgi:hypothetical protein